MMNKLLRRLRFFNAIYDDAYYAKDVEPTAAQAAPIIARTIVDRYAPADIIDVGCGTGAMLEAFRALGVQGVGLENSAAGVRRCERRGLNVIKFDIRSDEMPPYRPYNIALSLEVAEHIPARKADQYVKLLCDLAPVVIMSAAQPGQLGTNHINLQQKTYWQNKFTAQGRCYDWRATEDLAREWKQAGVAGFYHENLMVFVPPAKDQKS